MDGWYVYLSELLFVCYFVISSTAKYVMQWIAATVPCLMQGLLCVLCLYAGCRWLCTYKKFSPVIIFYHRVIIWNKQMILACILCFILIVFDTVKSQCQMIHGILYAISSLWSYGDLLAVMIFSWYFIRDRHWVLL